MMTEIELSNQNCYELKKWMNHMELATYKIIDFVNTRIFQEIDCDKVKKYQKSWDKLIAELYPEGLDDGTSG